MKLLLVALVVGPWFAAGVPLVPQAAPAVAAELTDLASVLEPLRTKHSLPALGGAIVADGKLVALGACGERELGGSVAVSASDLWHLGSCTKAMTATLAARLVEQGKIGWDASVESVFPQWKDKLHDDWRATTLEQLLTNRGGAPGSPPRELWIALGSREGTPQQNRTWFVGELLALEPEAKAGTKFIYSNQGFTIAGAMLEAATGKSWEELMRAELFAPLGMTSAGFGAPGSAEAVDQPRGHAKKPVKPGPRADNPAAIGPAGTVHASLADWAKFANAHLEGARGKSSFLKPESWKKLHTAPAGGDYAMGWGTAERSWAGGGTLSHSGSNTMWFCTIWLAPEKGEAYLVTTNTGADVASKACDEAVGALIASRKK